MRKKKVSLGTRFRRLVNTIKHHVYRVKCALFMRYNRIHAKRLPPTWVDRDVLLYHVVFQLIEDFIEQEEPFGPNFSRDGMYSHIEFLLEPDEYGHTNRRQWEYSAEVIEIYLWIKNEFSRYDDRMNGLYALVDVDFNDDGVVVTDLDGTPAHPQLELDFGWPRSEGFERINAEESLQTKTIGEMLHRIVDIRGFLWT